MEPTVNTSSNTHDHITALVDSLEAHEGISLTPRERQLCTTLLSGLAAAGQLSTPVPEGSLLAEFDFETATEAERWAYDQGRDDALRPELMGMDEIRDALEACVAALGRMADEQKANGR
jgi:hypothetical protein